MLPDYIFLTDLQTRVVRGLACGCFVCLKGRESAIKTDPRPVVPFVSINGSKNIDAKVNHNYNQKRCDYCFQPTGQGIRHPCSKLGRQKNLASMVPSTSPFTRGNLRGEFMFFNRGHKEWNLI